MNKTALYGGPLAVGAPESPAIIVKDPEASTKKANVPFITVENGVIHSSPLGGGQFFNYAELEFLIQSTFARTPATPVPDTEIEVAGATTNTVTIAEVAALNPGYTGILIPFILVQFTAPQLNQLPAGVITTSITIPTELAGNCVYTGLQIGVSNVTNRVNVVCVPFKLVQSRPRPCLGLISAAGSVIVAATGLATGTQTTVIIPGTTHPSIRASIKYGRQ